MTPPSSSPSPVLSVVMPAYNEEATIRQILALVLASPFVAELIVVDDCSTDRTWELLQSEAARDPRIRLQRHTVNGGKGAALQTGFRHATSEVVVIQDADLEYDPKDYARLIAPILDGRADAVLGTRFMGSEEHRVLYFWHSVGNLVLTQLSNMFTNLNLTDMETCYKAFRLPVAQALDIQERRFGVEPEICAKLAQMRIRIYEVAISYHGRTYDEGKKIGLKDGFEAIWCIFKYNVLERLSPLPLPSNARPSHSPLDAPPQP